ncbi:pyruvate dehydrogenase (acetyl-transferring) E1 component subunit alpha [Ruegeria marina]|uniref:Pyruvate dehydrogenase E1 component subunit alpha n=1 Tax=Ruegeria marina TaxID=639004 RepID=A0A1G6UY54_9RHOB|nr:pyruvate dehydrogenase (acetyl-transferring) E1 component subunit alpha [Ruegeria marina]SDD46218.1 pyruvate dehydrogenase E1 component alpha subunit [Ruegeria marina]
MTGHLEYPEPSTKPHRVLDANGNLVDDQTSIDDDVGFLEEAFKAMLRARRFDERLLKLQRQGAIGTFAPIKGQEAAQVGAASTLRDDDWFVPSFREKAAMLLLGVEMADIFLTAAGWNEGLAGKKGDRRLPETVPVSSQLPIAAGIAYAARLRGEDTVAMVFFGDGATSSGDFHEAMNFASVLKAPVVFVCQNNGWAISTPRSAQTASSTIAQKAHAYGMPSAQVDGNDVLAVRQVVEEAVERARTKGLPSMVEALTYRMEVHTTADDPSRYRDDDEIEAWRARDPITRVETFLRSRSQIDDAMVEVLEEQIQDEIDRAWAATKTRIAELEEQSDEVIFDHIFEDLTPPLKRQRKDFLKTGRGANDG